MELAQAVADLLCYHLGEGIRRIGNGPVRSLDHGFSGQLFLNALVFGVDVIAPAILGRTHVLLRIRIGLFSRLSLVVLFNKVVPLFFKGLIGLVAFGPLDWHVSFAGQRRRHPFIECNHRTLQLLGSAQILSLILNLIFGNVLRVHDADVRTLANIPAGQRKGHNLVFFIDQRDFCGVPKRLAHGAQLRAEQLTFKRARDDLINITIKLGVFVLNRAFVEQLLGQGFYTAQNFFACRFLAFGQIHLTASSGFVGITIASRQNKAISLLVGLCLALSFFAQALVLFCKTVDLSLLVAQLLLGLGLEKLLLFAHAALNLGTLHVKDLRLTELVDHHVNDAVLLFGGQVSKAVNAAVVLSALFLALALNAIQSSDDLVWRHAFGLQANGVGTVKQFDFALVFHGGSSPITSHVNRDLLVTAKLRLDHFYQGFGVLFLQKASLNSGLGEHV